MSGMPGPNRSAIQELPSQREERERKRSKIEIEVGGLAVRKIGVGLFKHRLRNSSVVRASTQELRVAVRQDERLAFEEVDQILLHHRESKFERGNTYRI
jgi:hypothetical protein